MKLNQKIKGKRYLIWIFTFIVCILTLGCKDCTIILTKDYLYTPCDDISNGFDLENIRPLTFEGKIPVEYEVLQRIDFSRIDRNISAKRKIYFKRKNSNYIWRKGANYSDVLPIDFQVNSWYLIRGLSHFGYSSVRLFIYVDDESNLIVYRNDLKTNW